MGVLGIIGSNAGDDHFGRYAVKRSNLFAIDFLPQSQGTAIAQLLTEDVRKSLRTAAKSISMPKFSTEDVEIIHGNEKFGQAGRTNWRDEDLSIAFNNAISSPFGGDGDDNSVFISPYTILYQMQQLIQDPLSGAGLYPREYKMNIILSIYGPDEREIERFLFHGAYLLSIDPGELSYDDSSALQVSASFKFDMWWRVRPGETTPPSELVGIDFDREG